MNKTLTIEERAVLEYVREKTRNNELHRFYPSDIVMNGKTIDNAEVDMSLRNLCRSEYITNSSWIAETTDGKQKYIHINITAIGLQALYGDDVVTIRMGQAFDAKTQLPFQ